MKANEVLRPLAQDLINMGTQYTYLMRMIKHIIIPISL